jgi:endoglucanase
MAIAYMFPKNEVDKIYYSKAGDHVKFGFPMASAMTVLSWGGIVFRTGYEKSGQTEHLLQAVRWGTDYLIKAHVSDYVLYGQVFNRL